MEEDEALRAIVNEHGAKNWKILQDYWALHERTCSACITGIRCSNLACTRLWSPEEDAIVEMVMPISVMLNGVLLLRSYRSHR